MGFNNGSASKQQDEMTLFDAMRQDLEMEIENGENRVREVELDAEQATAPKGFSKMYTPSPEEYA